MCMTVSVSCPCRGWSLCQLDCVGPGDDECLDAVVVGGAVHQLLAHLLGQLELEHGAAGRRGLHRLTLVHHLGVLPHVRRMEKRP